MGVRPSRPRGGAPLSVALVWCVLAACAGEPERPLERPAAEVESLTRSAPEEIRYELENLGHEIGDLESLLASGAVRSEPGADPAARLTRARSAYHGALDAIAASDPDRAADSLEVASGEVEEVKRSLGLAEEWGEPIDGDPVPVTVPEELSP